ncbi:MAG: transcriptional regulator Spx [Bacilli bacterium]|nr:transcriptional regulator Spx [Bacilli bacterium]
MLKVLVSPSCSSCRKVKKWLDENHIPYRAIDIFSDQLTYDDVLEAIVKSENGTEDIVSTRSKVFQEGNVDLEELSVSEFIRFVLANPSVLKRPIIIDDHRLQVGYNAEEISTFLPMARRLANESCTKDCPKWPDCENH